MRVADSEEAIRRDALMLLDLIAREPMKRSAYYACTLRWGENRFQRARRWLVERGLVRAGQDGQKMKYRVTREGLAFLREAKLRTQKEPKRASKREELEDFLLETVKRRGPISTGEVYREYRKFCGAKGIAPFTMRTIRNIMRNLAKRGLVSERPAHRGYYGSTTIYEYRGDKGG